MARGIASLYGGMAGAALVKLGSVMVEDAPLTGEGRQAVAAAASALDSQARAAAEDDGGEVIPGRASTIHVQAREALRAIIGSRVDYMAPENMAVELADLAGLCRVASVNLAAMAGVSPGALEKLWLQPTPFHHFTATHGREAPTPGPYSGTVATPPAPPAPPAPSATPAPGPGDASAPAAEAPGVASTGKGKGKAKPAKPADKKRRTAADILALQALATGYVQNHGTAPGGLAVSAIAKALESSPDDLTQPLSQAVKAGTIFRTGKLRLTRYHATAEGAAAAEAAASAPPAEAAPAAAPEGAKQPALPGGDNTAGA
jgi:hypothetical protein